MTTLIERPGTASPNYLDTHLTVSPQPVITADHGQFSVMEVAQAYFSLGERPIPLCDASHACVTPRHRDGYLRKDGTVAAPCGSPGKAPLEQGPPASAQLLSPTCWRHRALRRLAGRLGLPRGGMPGNWRKK